MSLHHIKPTLKKDKEFLVKFNGSFYYTRVIITKTVFDLKKPKPTDHFFYKYSPTEEVNECFLNQVSDIKEPVNNTEMFIMWTNWNSMKRIDLQRAEQLRHEITNTLKDRSYVMYGTSKLEAYDYEKMYELRTDINTKNYKFKIGNEYQLQNGEIIKVLGRSDTVGYECLICSDNKYRYDRSNCNIDSPDKGRCTGTSSELFYPYNIIHEKYGNRYEVMLKFCEQYGYTHEQAYEIKTILGNSCVIDSEYRRFLDENNIVPIEWK